MSESADGIVRKYSCISLQVRLPEGTLYNLERLRIAMEEKNKEHAVARAFKEFAEKKGVTFSPEPVDYALLEEFGLEASGNTILLKRKLGLIICFLPEPNEKDFWAILKTATGKTNSGDIVAESLNEAHRIYVR